MKNNMRSLCHYSATSCGQKLQRSILISRLTRLETRRCINTKRDDNSEGSFQLLPTARKAGQNEEAFFQNQVAKVREWWRSSRFDGIKRPYTAEEVVSKRGTLVQSYPSSLMAMKLHNLLQERASQGLPVHTSSWDQSMDTRSYEG